MKFVYIQRRLPSGYLAGWHAAQISGNSVPCRQSVYRKRVGYLGGKSTSTSVWGQLIWEASGRRGRSGCGVESGVDTLQDGLDWPYGQAARINALGRTLLQSPGSTSPTFDMHAIRQATAGAAALRWTPKSAR
jgi:hypothetical protein